MCKANHTATRSPSSAGAEHKPILAERFKTKLCQNFIKTGVCPYEIRCMFAHGEHEMRTKEMNLRDRLVTEDSIKNFQRAKMIADRSAERKKKRLAQLAAVGESPLLPSKDDADTSSNGEPATPAAATTTTLACVDGADEVRAKVSATPYTPETIASVKSPDAEGGAVTPVRGLLHLASPATTSPSAGRRYRHDPYTPVALKTTAPATTMTTTAAFAPTFQPPVAVAPYIKAQPAMRTRALPMPPPLCTTALAQGYSSATNTPTTTPMTAAYALPTISPLALAMGRQSVSAFHNTAGGNNNYASTPVKLTHPVAVAVSTPPAPEYKTTYGAASIVAAHHNIILA